MAMGKQVLCADSPVITVADLAGEYLNNIKVTMKPSAYALYENYTRNEVVPRIGRMDAAGFNRKNLEEFLAQCLWSRDGKNKRSRNTMYAIEAVIRSMFRYGGQNGFIPQVSLGSVKYGRQHTEGDVEVLSKWEVQGLFRDAHERGYAQEIQVLLPLYLGLNLSELSGLQWEDVDLEVGNIFIHHCLKRVMQTMPDGSTSTSIITYELDQREQRMIWLPDHVHKVLEKAFYGEGHKEKHWFVASLDYKYVECRTLQYRLKNLGAHGGIQNLSYRCLRDTFAVTSLQAGANVMTLAKILGINMQVVCDRYGEWMRYDDSFLSELGEEEKC